MPTGACVPLQLVDLLKAKKGLTASERRVVGGRADRCKADHESQSGHFEKAKAGALPQTDPGPKGWLDPCAQRWAGKS